MNIKTTFGTREKRPLVRYKPCKNDFWYGFKTTFGTGSTTIKRLLVRVKSDFWYDALAKKRPLVRRGLEE